MNCNNCGKQIKSNSAFCNNCGCKVERKASSSEHSDINIKKFKKPLFIGISVALVAIIVIGIVGTIIKVSNNPINKILKATEKTIDQGSFEIKIHFDEDGYEESVEGIIEIDKDKKNLATDFTFEYDGGTTREILKDYTNVFIDNEDGEIWIEKDAIDSKIMDAAFDIYGNINLRNPAKSDFEKIFETLDDLSDGEIDIEYNKDTKELVKLSDDILSKYFKKFSSKKWLEDCLGYEKDGSKYIFEPDLEALLEDLIIFVEDNEEDISELIEKAIDVIDDDILDEFDIDKNIDVDDLLDVLDELMDEIEKYPDDVPEIHVEIIIEKGLISEIICNIDIDGEEIEIEIELSEYGEAKVDDIDDIVKAYKGYTVINFE